MELKARWNHCHILLHQGDITALKVDAIVNAANAELLPGGGVCGAIFRKAGPRLNTECETYIRAHGSVPTGQAVTTGGGLLPAKAVIHAVGPVYAADAERAPELLADAYRNSLAQARQHQLSSVAFPCISTGIYGYPAKGACTVALRAVRDELNATGGLKEVVFCVFGDSDRTLYEAALDEMGG